MLGYLDPGSVSAGLSVVAAGVAGAGVVAKNAMGRLRRKKGAAEFTAVDPDHDTDEQPSVTTSDT